MNILIVTPWFPNRLNDQHGNFILDSVESLSASGHQVHVLVTRPYMPGMLFGLGPNGCKAIEPMMYQRGYTLECERYLSIPRNHLRFVSNRLYVRGCLGAAIKLVKKYNIDVIHAHTELAGYMACVVRGKTGVPVVTTLHGINRDRRYLYGTGQKNFLSRVFSCPDRLVLVGESLRDFVAPYVKSTDHVRVVYNGFREQGARLLKNRVGFSGNGKINFISVSNLNEGKGVDVNLAALGRAELAIRTDWHYHIVGDGPMRPALESQSKILGLVGRVTFHGQCQHDEVFELLSRCDVFSLPSAPEAFGVAYLEAMACGLLTIGAEGQGPASFVSHGQNGLLVSSSDNGGLAELFCRILTAREEMRNIAATGQRTVWDRFRWESHAKGLTVVFAEVVKNTRLNSFSDSEYNIAVEG